MYNNRGRAAVVVLVVVLVFGVFAGFGWYLITDGGKTSVASAFDQLKMAMGMEGLPEAKPIPGPLMPSPEEPSPQPDKVITPPADLVPDIQTPDQAVTFPGMGGAQPAEEDNSPAAVLKACMEKLEQDDTIGAEQFVSEKGMHLTLGGTTGIHEILWKGMFKIHAYDEIGYDQGKIAGQTALFPIYTNLGRNRMIAVWIVMANRGDGWKLDHFSDPRRY